MYNFGWNRNKKTVYEMLNKYFGLSEEKIDMLVEKNYPTQFDKQKLVAVVAGVVYSCKNGATAEEISQLEKNNLIERRKSGEAILSKLKFHDEEQPNDIFLRIRSLFSAISEKGIDIYKTIYMSTLTDGNFRSTPNLKMDSFETNRGDDRDFDNIYNTLQSTLRLSSEETNALIEKCPATIIAKVGASNVKAMYRLMLMDIRLVNPDLNRNIYFFRADESDIPRVQAKSKMIEDGFINCPTIFASSPETVLSAFNYISEKVPKERIEKEYNAYLESGNKTMTPFWCKYKILRSWVNDNFSILTINADKMRDKERFINNLGLRLLVKDEDGYVKVFDDLRPRRRYDFSFLFDNPVSISTMNSIPIGKLQINAEKNISLLEFYVGTINSEKWKDYETRRKGVAFTVRNYIKSNHYVLAMDNTKLSNLLQSISLHDAKNPQKQLFPRFLKLGKSLFANKHNIDFDEDLVFEKLTKTDDIQILDVSSMNGWGRVEKFVELFCDNDKSILENLHRLHQEKLERDERGSKQLRHNIRTLVSQEGGWNKILKDKDATLSMASKVNEITDKRFEIEKVSRTDRLCDDMSVLKLREKAFAEEIKQNVARLKRAFSEKRDKLNKRFTDVDKLYNYTMMFLESECFDDKEPISDLFNEEIAVPFEEALKSQEGAHSDAQQSIFGEPKLIVPVASDMVKPIKDLKEAIGKNYIQDYEARLIKIERATRDGK